jgi:hypothetical protein
MQRVPLLFITKKRPNPLSVPGFAIRFSRPEQQMAKLILQDHTFLHWKEFSATELGLDPR